MPAKEELTQVEKDFEWLAKNIPCQSACPAGTNIPECLHAIYNGEYDRAYEINLRKRLPRKLYQHPESFTMPVGGPCVRP